VSRKALVVGVHGVRQPIGERHVELRAGIDERRDDARHGQVGA